jgi:hypothetical protein
VTADVLDVFYHWSADESWWLLNGDISCGLWDALATVDNIVREGGQVPGRRGGGRATIRTFYSRQTGQSSTEANGICGVDTLFKLIGATVDSIGSFLSAE